MPQIEIPNFDEVQLAPPRLDPGDYVATITEKPALEENQNGKPYLAVKMKIVEGPEQSDPDPATGSRSPAGRNWTDRLYLVDGAYFRVKQLLVAAGLLARDDHDSPMAKGKFNSDMLVGTTFNIRVTTQMSKDGKEYRNVDYIIQ